MKLEFLEQGSADAPLLRLYGFETVEAMRLREACRTCADGLRQVIPLHEEWWIERVDECSLDLRRGERDLGVVQRAPLRFECILTPEGWTDVVLRIEPFCAPGSLDAYQWLNGDGEISLLLSVNGQW
jgi:hypothetical protein